jgi:hypothetical protein
MKRGDVFAIGALIALWLLFFWRMFTPFAADQVSLRQGDFSGQFVAFAGYQYNRLSNGEIPLWNPYNNGGLPFIADTQAAVFYPPRLIALALAHVTGGFAYHTLELEMTAHVLLHTLMMYGFVRYLLRRERGVILGGLTAAVVGGYSGFMSGYPPLQLALMEAGVWLPLAGFGIAAAGDTSQPRLKWLAITGFAYGMSWMAGHPQTTYLLTVFLLAYWAYIVYTRRWSWRLWIIGALIFGAIGGGMAAVQLLPGFEYLLYTTRAGFGFDAKSNGFPIQDIVQFVFPGIVSLFSPLYIGFIALILAMIAVVRVRAWFWGGTALFALIWSFGANAALYPLLYNVLPGLRFFRGQERGAYLVVNALAVLAGIGLVYLINRSAERDYPFALRVRGWLSRVFWAALTFAGLIFALWLGNPDGYSAIIQPIAFGTVMIGVAFLIMPMLMAKSQRLLAFTLLPVIIVFELFTVNMTAPSTYDRVPPDAQISMTPPPLVAQVLADGDVPFRVDGVRGLTANYGSLYGAADIRGISPLWLAGMASLIDGELSAPTAWELLAVRYVFSDWRELPIPAQIVGQGADFYGEVNLHRLADPRPFALIMHRAVLADSDEMAYAMLGAAGFNPRQTLILNESVEIELSQTDSAPAQVIAFAPERIVVRGESDTPALLSISLPHYPGWTATVNGVDMPIHRAYGGLSAVAVPGGAWEVKLIFSPLTFRIGASLSILTWLALVAFGVWQWSRSIRYKSGSPNRIDASTPS